MPIIDCENDRHKHGTGRITNRQQSGDIFLNGQNLAHLKKEELRLSRKNIQMVFQDPSASFNPKQKVKDIVCEPLLNYKLIKKSQRKDKAAELLEMVSLPADFLERFPHSMSGGQRQRVGIARALALEPEVLVCDEATCALDVSVQETILHLLAKLQAEKGITMAFVCHDLALLRLISHRLAIMYLGSIVEEIPSQLLGKVPSHPYTQLLVDSVFEPNTSHHKEIVLTRKEADRQDGTVCGCKFYGRCATRTEKCENEKPPLKMMQEGHRVACHHYEQLEI